MTDIIELAKLIDTNMRLFLNQTPEDSKTEINCINWTMKEVMQQTKGHVSPSVIMQLIAMHRTPYKDFNISIEC